MATIHSFATARKTAQAAGVPPEPPPSKSHPSYKMHAAKVREYRALGSRYEVEAMFALMEFERQTVAWKSSPSMKFDDVIREERFFPIGKWRAFKKAVDVVSKTKDLNKDQMKRLGVNAVNLIIRQPAQYHRRLIKTAIKYRNLHEVEPTYQYVSRLIHSTIKGKDTKPSGPTRGQLLAYVDKLKDQIRELGHKPVAMDKKPVVKE